MKIGYFDCFSGAAGDMIVGACLDAGADEVYLRAELGKLGLSEVTLEISRVKKNGIAATQFNPILHHHHNHSDSSDIARGEHHHPPHRHLPTILELIDKAGIGTKAAENAKKVFLTLADAEAKVHGIAPEKVHFHEVGAADAIMDIVGGCLALESLGIEKLHCSPLVVGSGTVKCDHGIMPVPAPATAELIKGIPTTPTTIPLEMLTPTGAAVITTLASTYGPMPAMEITDIGYGAGQRDIPERPNVLRLLVGETSTPNGPTDTDEIGVLEANLDDTTAEVVGYVTETLLEAGALDVFCTSIMMKKNRPGTQVTVLCRPSDIAPMEAILFKESTTFGIRRYTCQRSTLPREEKSVETIYGKIRVKIGYFDGQAITHSVEFEDCRRAAVEHQVSLKEVITAAQKACDKS